MILNAVICVWNEEDIIESTVKHAFSQGCSNVFIVDNNSTDKTIEIAERAGAQLAVSFETKYFDELKKIGYLNSVVKKYNDGCSEEVIWWLYLDADEFPNIDSELTIIDFLRGLDSSVKAVHGNMYDHLPTHPPYIFSGYHPADCMPIACKGNTKIPLIRYDKGEKHFYSCGGAHTLDTCGMDIMLAKDVLDIHHFNYRKPEDSIGRIRSLLTKNKDGSSRMDWMDYKDTLFNQKNSSNSFYRERYINAKLAYSANINKAMYVDTLQYNFSNLKRWYNIYDFFNIDCGTYHDSLNLGIYYYFLNEYDMALCRFNDALEKSICKKDCLLIHVKIAKCLSKTNKMDAIKILATVIRCEYEDVSLYAKSVMNNINDELTEGIHKKNNFFEFALESYCGAFKLKKFENIDSEIIV